MHEKDVLLPRGGQVIDLSQCTEEDEVSKLLGLSESPALEVNFASLRQPIRVQRG